MLKQTIEKILREYSTFSKEIFKNHEFATYLRKDVPVLLASYLNLSDIYSVKASPGNGAWANIPWIAIFNKLVTETVRFGFFIVYLFPADFSGVYLSLIQGTASQKEIYGLGNSKKVLRNQAKLLRSMILNQTHMNFLEKIDLKLEVIPKTTTARRLGQAYEAGNILAIYYSKNNFPSSQKLLDDLFNLIEIYEKLINTQPLEADLIEINSEEVLFEDLAKFNTHKRIERSLALSKRVKQIQGYTCKACDFNFEYHYGEIGKEYIEAHHNVPISKLEKAKIKLDPLKDFTVLCSNCHRMIHRIRPTPSLEEFKKIIQK